MKFLNVNFREALAKFKVHQWSWALWVVILSDLKYMAVCQEWDKQDFIFQKHLFGKSRFTQWALKKFLFEEMRRIYLLWEIVKYRASLNHYIKAHKMQNNIPTVQISEIHCYIVKSNHLSTIFGVLCKKYNKIKIIVLPWQQWRKHKPAFSVDQFLGFIWRHRSDGVIQNTVIRVSRLFVLCINLAFGGKYMEFRIIFSLQHIISINTFEVDPRSNSLHNAVVKPKNY
jgi:hypothetical protein